MDTQRLIEERARLWAQMSEILDTAAGESRDLSAEEAQRYDKLEGELETKSAAIKRAERHAAHDSELSAVDVSMRVLPGGDRVVERAVRPEATEEYRDAWLRYMRGGREALNEDDRAVLRRGYRVDEDRAASPQTVTGAGGGYTIPAVFEAQLIQAMKAYGGVRANATVITTDGGAQMAVPTLDDTSNKGRLLTINTQVTTSDVAFGQKVLDAYKYSSDQVLVPIELVQDSAFDMDGLVTSVLAERLGRITEEHYTTGTGSSQPQGIVGASAQGKEGTSGQTTSVIADDLVDLYYALDPAYRDGAVWMMADATIKAIRKLKTGVSGDNTYLWGPGLQAGQPDTLLGRPIISCPHMATMAASAKAILFGNFKRFWIRDVRGIRIVRMVERYADYDQVGFVAFLRTDSELIAPASAIRHFANPAS